MDTLELLPLKVFLVALSALSMSHGVSRKCQPNTCASSSHLSIESFMTRLLSYLPKVLVFPAKCQACPTLLAPVSPGFVDSVSSKLLFITFSKGPVVSL